MYSAKHAGGNQIAIFTPAMRANTHPSGRDVITKAIAAGDLTVAYQPVVAKDLTIMSVEALVRWSHPSLGIVGADHLLALSGASGAMAEIDAWMLQRAVEQVAEWEHVLPATAYVSINVNDRWITRHTWAGEILDLLDRQGVDPTRLGIEFDHAALTRDPAATLRSLEELSRGGVRLILDDFGSTRSTLGHLEAIPLSCVKIDSSLMARIEVRPAAQRLLQATTAFCHAYGVPVIAKGVAHERWLRRAREAQVDGYQGFFLRRPSSADPLGEWIGEVSRDPRLIPA
jgi:EAL domain-containing protein (putative c-di-GMP-specific phosphodiesterase class I)